MKRHTLSVAIVGALLVAAAAPTVAVAATRSGAVVAKSTQVSAVAAVSAESAASSTVDLRYGQGGSFVNHDYLRSTPAYKNLSSLFTGPLGVYKYGGVVANGKSSPVLATLNITALSLKGHTGTATVTITSTHRVVWSASDFTWMSAKDEEGATDEADITSPAGTHSRKLTFDDVKAKGVVDLSIAPTRNYDWVVN